MYDQELLLTLGMMVKQLEADNRLFTIYIGYWIFKNN